jgi:signal transduction histidine kinase
MTLNDTPDHVRLLAILEERDRLGREMHDGLAQVLGYVNAKAQAAREYLRAGQTELAAQHLEELILAAREAYTDARETIADLRMEGVRERPLPDLLTEYVARFERQSGVQAHLVVEPSWQARRLPLTARVQLLRIVQEALTNIRKHAQAQCAAITLNMADGFAQVQVEDDGQGFALSRLLSPEFSRYGLRTMRERAQAVGGTFRIESLPEAGTRVRVQVPLAPDPAPT